MNRRANNPAQEIRDATAPRQSFVEQLSAFFRRNLYWFLIAGFVLLLLQDIFGTHGVLAMRRSLERVEITPDLLDYIVAIVTATRKDPQVQVGASPRGGLALVQLARGQALLNQRDYVVPDDIKQVAVPALAHRITLRPELWVRQVSSDDVMAKLLSSVPTPKTDPSARAAGRDQAPAVTG